MVLLFARWWDGWRTWAAAALLAMIAEVFAVDANWGSGSPRSTAEITSRHVLPFHMSRIVFGLTPNAEATEADEGTNFASVLGLAICFMWYIAAAACAVKILRAVRDLSRRGKSEVSDGFPAFD